MGEVYYDLVVFGVVWLEGQQDMVDQKITIDLSSFEPKRNNNYSSDLNFNVFLDLKPMDCTSLRSVLLERMSKSAQKTYNKRSNNWIFKYIYKKQYTLTFTSNIKNTLNEQSVPIPLNGKHLTAYTEWKPAIQI